MPRGGPTLTLVVHPRVGPLGEVAVGEALLAGVGSGTGAGRLTGLSWRDARLLRLERRPPMATASGKIRHLRVPALCAGRMTHLPAAMRAGGP